MKIFRLLIKTFINAYSFSADPNLFGSKKRREGKEIVAGEFKAMAGETQSEIDAIKSENPFDSAAAKMAMAKASRTTKQMQNRLLNTMGANATPEALIAAQGSVNEGIGSAAGQIAAGSEANKKNEIANLRGLKQNQMNTYGAVQSSAEEERGSGWNTLFQGISALGNLAEGVGGVINPLSKLKG